MNDSAHPLARDPGAIRLLEHNLLDIETVLGADSFTLDGDQVVFRRRAAGPVAATSWRGRLGDWLVRDDADQWHIATDPTVAVNPRPAQGVEGPARGQRADHHPV